MIHTNDTKTKLFSKIYFLIIKTWKKLFMVVCESVKKTPIIYFVTATLIRCQTFINKMKQGLNTTKQIKAGVRFHAQYSVQLVHLQIW